MKIVLSAFVALLLIGCGDNKESHATAVQQKTETAAPIAKVATKSVVETPIIEQKPIAKPVEKAAPVEEKKMVSAAPVVAKVDGAKLFTVCSSCHGAHAEKHALGKSQVIQGWAASKITTALKGYQNGTYGGAMKAVMKGQASKLSDADIQALAEYISKL